MTPSSSNTTPEEVFQPVDDPLELEAILASRLPISTNIYNVLKLKENWKSEHQWFTLQDPTVDDVWIVATNIRKDLGRVISISRPPNAAVTSCVRTAFSNCDFMDWGETFMFASVETAVSSMITDISIWEKGDCTTVHPCYLYYMDREDAVKLEIPSGDFQVKPINNKEGVDFILKTWKYAASGTDEYLEKCLGRNPSAGVYVNDAIVAGAILDAHGLIGMLYSLSEFRGKGFGRYVMHHIMKESAGKGLVPGCTVELRNDISKAFQEKIGFKIAGKVDYICYEKTGF
jgi:GNAT superfamily N-acetyltransferase